MKEILIFVWLIPSWVYTIWLLDFFLFRVWKDDPGKKFLRIEKFFDGLAKLHPLTQCLMMMAFGGSFLIVPALPAQVYIILTYDNLTTVDPTINSLMSWSFVVAFVIYLLPIIATWARRKPHLHEVII